MEKAGNNQRLTSWKEIADYLGRESRTCWRWEKELGLPIHRADPASPKSRVYAFKDELDDWLRREKAAQNDSKGLSQKTFWRKATYFLAPALGAIAILIVLVIKEGKGSKSPAGFKIEGTALVVLDEKGGRLWQYNTHLEDLRDDKTYHGHFQRKRNSEGDLSVELPWIIIKDINRDLTPEVLFCALSENEQGGSDLFCFDSRGREMWRFKPGREMHCGARVYSSDHSIRGFDTIDLDEDGRLETVVLSYQSPNWLSQLALLDSDGTVLGEFWNSGHLADFILVDLQGDGQKELLAVGLNNEYGKGCLVVFNPRNISGGSPQNKAEFTCRDLEPGSEEYYLLFPRTDVDVELHPVEAMGEIKAANPRILSLETAVSGIYFIMDFDLTVEDVTLSHGFMQKHHEAILAGEVHSDINNPSYKEALISSVLYYDGQGWTRTPTSLLPRANGPN